MGIIANFKQRMLIVLFLSQVVCGTAFADPLQIAVEDDAGPWSEPHGRGFANEVVCAAFKAAGVEIELSVVPYARCKAMVLNGKVAACFSMSWLPEFAGKIVFAEKPLFHCYADYFADSKRHLEAKQEKNLPRGTVVGIVSGYEYPPSVYALKKKGIVVFEESESEGLNLKKLLMGRIDVALVNYNKTKPAELLMARAGVTCQMTKPAELLMARAGVTCQVKRVFRSGVLRSFIGFSRKHPQGMEALKKFNQGHRIISRNGIVRKIEQKWEDMSSREVVNLAGKKPK